MGKRGPKPRPTNLRILYGERKDRINKHEPALEAAAKPPRAPEHLGPIARREWNRVVKQLWEKGLLTHVDRHLLEAYASFYEDWRNAADLIKRALLMPGMRGGDIKKNPAWQIKRDAHERLLAAARELGMTPSARSGIEVPEHDDDADLSAILS